MQRRGDHRSRVSSERRPLHQIELRLAGLAALSSLVLLAGCGGGNGTDTTPPEFLEVLVRLEAPTPPNPRGEFNITSSDVSRVGIGAGLTIRVLATAGDSESGITGITIVSNVTWKCSLGRSEIIGILESASLPFAPASPPSPPPNLWQINVVADPIATTLSTGCATSPPGHGPVLITGHVRVVATNGADQTDTSGTFVFEYVNIGRL